MTRTITRDAGRPFATGEIAPCEGDSAVVTLRFSGFRFPRLLVRASEQSDDLPAPLHRFIPALTSGHQAVSHVVWERRGTVHLEDVTLETAAPFGLFDPADPVTDPWAQLPGELPALLSAEPERLEAALAAPEGADATEWGLMLHRATEASARLLWPFGDLGISRRLHRIRQPTLIVWGGRDRVIPPSYAKRFAAGVSGPVEVREIEGAGHVLEIDRPDEVAGAVLGFLS